MSSVQGIDTPDALELRKRRIEDQMEQRSVIVVWFKYESIGMMHFPSLF